MSLGKPPDGGPGDKAALEKVQKRMEDRAVGMALEQIFEPKHQLVQRKWFVRREKIQRRGKFSMHPMLLFF